MNNNPYAVNLVYKQHEQDIIRFVEKARVASTEDNTNNNNNLVRRIVSQLKKRA